MDRYPWVTATVGRMNNPFVTTDLLWDGDLAFEGAAATFKYDWKKSGLFAIDDHSRTLFATVGIFAVDESEITSQDKWLYALQLGGDFTDNPKINSRWPSAITITKTWSVSSTRKAPILRFHCPEFLSEGQYGIQYRKITFRRTILIHQKYASH